MSVNLLPYLAHFLISVASLRMIFAVGITNPSTTSNKIIPKTQHKRKILTACFQPGLPHYASTQENKERVHQPNTCLPHHTNILHNPKKFTQTKSGPWKSERTIEPSMAVYPAQFIPKLSSASGE